MITISWLRDKLGSGLLLRSASWLMLEQFFRLLAGLAVGIWVARYLGPTQYGLLNYAFVFVALFANLSKAGIDAVVVRELVRAPENRESLLPTAFWIKQLGSLLSLLIISGIVALSGSDGRTIFLVVVVASGLLFQSVEVVDFSFQAELLSKYSAWARLFQVAFSSMLKVFLILTNAELEWFAAVSAIEQMTIAVFYWGIYTGKLGRSLSFCFNRDLALKLLGDGWPLLLSGLAITVYTKFDQILVAKFLGETSLGQYSVALRLSEMMNVLPVVLGTVLFPAIVRMAAIDPEASRYRMQRLYDAFVLVTGLLALVTTLVSGPLIHLAYGADYDDAQAVLAVYIWTIVPTAIGIVNVKLLIAGNLTRHVLIRNLVGGAVSVIVNCSLIPVFGTVGAAISSLIAVTIANVLVFAASSQTRHLFFMSISSLSLVGPIRRTVHYIRQRRKRP